MWDSVSYFETQNGKLKLTKGKYTFCRVTGLNHMEDVIANQKSSNSFLAVDDTDDGTTVKRGGGYFNRRMIVVYILKKFNTKSQSDREEKVTEVRSVYRSLCSKLLIDKNKIAELTYLDDSRIPYHEVPGMWIGETCGLYFSITIEEPVSLVYDATEWD